MTALARSVSNEVQSLVREARELLRQAVTLPSPLRRVEKVSLADRQLERAERLLRLGS